MANATKSAANLASAVKEDIDMKTGEITTQQGGALAMPELDFEADAGKGTEGVDKESQAIPFLVVLQSNSPAVVDETVEGAKAGLILNTVTGELFNQIVVVPCGFQRRYLEWAPRSKGGGFKGEHKPTDIDAGKVGEKRKDEKGVERLFNGENQLKDTRSHFVLAVRPDGTYFPALISLSSTQIKKSKKWVGMITNLMVRSEKTGKMFNPPSFAHQYRITTTKESNDQGTWFGVLVDSSGPVKDAEVYGAARSLHELVSSGKVEVAQPDDNVAAGEVGGGDDERAF